MIEELLTELAADDRGAAPTPERIAEVAPERIAASVRERALMLGPDAPDVARAVAVLGDGASSATVAAIARVDVDRAVTIVDGLAAASVLAPESGRGFAHPLLAAAVYEDIPTARRVALHARAAEVLAAQGAGPEQVAAHVLLCEPGAVSGAADVLEEAARGAGGRGAPESAAAYLRRALAEPLDRVRRGELLHRLGSAEVALRDPASVAHLREAAELADDPRRALDIALELIELLAVAGQWELTLETIEAAIARFGETGLPALLDLEAVRAAYRGNDPALVEDYDRDLPRLSALVEGRSDEETSRLRWVLAGIGALRDAPRAAVLELVAASSQNWSMDRGGRESSLVTQGMFALLLVDALEEAESVGAFQLEDGRRRGALFTMLTGTGYMAALNARRGRLAACEADIETALELILGNELSLMALTTFVHAGLDAIVERKGLERVADLIEELEIPPLIGRTMTGAMALEARAAVRLLRGERERAAADLREAERIYRPLEAGPRHRCWRSRLALALPPESRGEALALAEEELELARRVASPRAEGAALRAVALLRGGEEGIELLRHSLARLGACPSPLERARSRAELGAALRRAKRRAEAREELRLAADLAQRCGAERLEERIREELRIAGAKPRRRALSGVDSLTPSELRVATAAASGATNREIARDLFVSLRTVEMHLTNSYRKLGISSRAELAAALDLGTQRPPSS